MAGAKQIYWRLPVWLQNIAVSVKGARRNVQRHGGIFSRCLAESLQRQQWSEDQLTEYQMMRLRKLVAFAMKNVPYFRQHYGELGIDPETLDDISQLPILDKDVYRTHGDQLVADCWPRRKLLQFHTSGSTGTPLTCYMQIDDFRERMAFLARQFVWAGVEPKSRIATLTGNLIAGPVQTRPPFWRYNLPGKQIIMSSYHMLDAYLPDYFTALASFRPAVIEGYPSAIYRLAHWGKLHGVPATLKPKAIFVTAECFHDYQRTLIEDVFGAPCYNYYGSSEGAPLITQCREGALHVNTDSGIFELLRPDDSSAGPGEVGELVVTTFSSRAMPLIRFRMRDLAVWETPRSCPCGWHMPIIRELIGRMDDMVYSRERGWVGRLSQVMKVFPGSIRESQIIQESIDNIVVKIVPDPQRFRAEQTVPMLADLHARLGSAMNVRVEYVDAIPKGANNKFKYVVCKLDETEKKRLWHGTTKTD